LPNGPVRSAEWRDRAERDGPMLIVGLQQIHGRRIELPSRVAQHPDPLRLARRYEAFEQAS
jgi:putative restriction endonuclease